MQNIKTALEDTLNQLGINNRIEEYKVLSLWDDVASVLSNQTQAISISDGGSMTVNVANSIILHNLSMYKRKYMEKINLLAGKSVIKDIVFRIGKIDKRDKEPNSRENYVKKLHETQLDRKDIENIDNIVSSVEDDEMRDILKNLFINQSKLTKMRGGIG